MVRLYPPFGYSILYEEYNLTVFDHQKNTTHMIRSADSGCFPTFGAYTSLGVPYHKGSSKLGLYEGPTNLGNHHICINIYIYIGMHTHIICVYIYMYVHRHKHLWQQVFRGM